MSKYIKVGVGFTPYDPDKNEFMDLSNKHILDATCGSRTIWFQKECASAVYMDCREEHGTAIWKSSKNDSVRKLDVEPDVV